MKNDQRVKARPRISLPIHSAAQAFIRPSLLLLFAKDRSRAAVTIHRDKVSIALPIISHLTHSRTIPHIVLIKYRVKSRGIPVIEGFCQQHEGSRPFAHLARLPLPVLSRLISDSLLDVVGFHLVPRSVASDSTTVQPAKAGFPFSVADRVIDVGVSEPPCEGAPNVFGSCLLRPLLSRAEDLRSVGDPATRKGRPLRRRMLRTV